MLEVGTFCLLRRTQRSRSGIYVKDTSYTHFMDTKELLKPQISHLVETISALQVTIQSLWLGRATWQILLLKLSMTFKFRSRPRKTHLFPPHPNHLISDPSPKRNTEWFPPLDKDLKHLKWHRWLGPKQVRCLWELTPNMSNQLLRKVSNIFKQMRA